MTDYDVSVLRLIEFFILLMSEGFFENWLSIKTFSLLDFKRCFKYVHPKLEIVRILTEMNNMHPSILLISYI